MQRKIKIYLDDLRTPIEDGWYVVRDYRQFINALRLYGLENITLISLDHDLGPEAIDEYFKNVRNNFTLNYENIINEKTGYDCAKFLVDMSVQKNVPIPPVQVHSANPIGCANIIGYINNYLKNCKKPQTCTRVQVPFKIENNQK